MATVAVQIATLNDGDTADTVAPGEIGGDARVADREALAVEDATAGEVLLSSLVLSLIVLLLNKSDKQGVCACSRA